MLIAPLDWGLGHTTRCVPLIRFLLNDDRPVLFAGNHWQRDYICKIFPSLETVHLEGYDVRYARSGTLFLPKLIWQIPRVLRTIRNEQLWLQDIVKKYNIAGIISDNRYGLYHPEVLSVVMTHQLTVLSGAGNVFDSLIRKMHFRQLNRFGECWVVDVPDVQGLSGILAHPPELPPMAKYLGLLSQFHSPEPLLTSKQHLLVLLSGPEPQRSILSGILWRQLQGYKGKVIFAEGSANAPAHEHIPLNVTYHNLLAGAELEAALKAASVVICRSGYSTLMDLVALEKKAIIIPTPGQTEQEYLGMHLHEQGIFYCMEQDHVNLEIALREIESFPFRQFELEHPFEQFQPVISSWLDTLDAISNARDTAREDAL